MVERSLSMREVPGSIPGASMVNILQFMSCDLKNVLIIYDLFFISNPLSFLLDV